MRSRVDRFLRSVVGVVCVAFAFGVAARLDRRALLALGLSVLAFAAWPRRPRCPHLVARVAVVLTGALTFASGVRVATFGIEVVIPTLPGAAFEIEGDTAMLMLWTIDGIVTATLGLSLAVVAAWPRRLTPRPPTAA